MPKSSWARAVPMAARHSRPIAVATARRLVDMDIEYLPRAGNAPRLDGVVMVGGARSPHGTELPVPRLTKPVAVHPPPWQYGRRTVPDTTDIQPLQEFVEHSRFQSGVFQFIAAINRSLTLFDPPPPRPHPAGH